MKTNIKMKISLSLVLLCLVSCIILLIGIPTTLAFFSGTVASKNNVISTGKYDAYISVDGATDTPQKEVTVNITDSTAKTVYVKNTPGSTAPGYCVITENVGNKTYYAVIGDTPVTVKVNQTATIKVTPHWGTMPETPPSDAEKLIENTITVGTLPTQTPPLQSAPEQTPPPAENEPPSDPPQTNEEPTPEPQPETQPEITGGETTGQ